jgi:hypothetical protein
MKYIVIILFFPLLFSAQCSKQKNEIPSCIQQKIEGIKSHPKGSDASEINEYIYHGKHVYLFNSPCCDMYNPLLDDNCNNICAPTGGIAGGGDGKCSDFNSNAKFVKLVWKDPR